MSFGSSLLSVQPSCTSSCEPTLLLHARETRRLLETKVELVPAMGMAMALIERNGADTLPHEGKAPQLRLKLTGAVATRRLIG